MHVILSGSQLRCSHQQVRHECQGFGRDRGSQFGHTLVPLSDPAVLAGLTCQEASIHSRETFMPCGAPAAAIVWHERDGKHLYLMCAHCAAHNIRNRGGRLLMATDPAVLRSLAVHIS